MWRTNRRTDKLMYITSCFPRSGLSLMVHMNTGCMVGDHTERALWAGERRWGGECC